MSRTMAAAITGLALSLSVAAQTNIATLGPQVGGKAIDFELMDQFGRSQTLSALAGPNGTMLVFFRSADW